MSTTSQLTMLVNALTVEFGKTLVGALSLFNSSRIAWGKRQKNVGLFLFQKKLIPHSKQKRVQVLSSADLPHINVFGWQWPFAYTDCPNSSSLLKRDTQFFVGIAHSDLRPINIVLVSPCSRHADPAFAIKASCNPCFGFWNHIQGVWANIWKISCAMPPVTLIVLTTKSVYKFSKIFACFNTTWSFGLTVMGPSHIVSTFVRTIFSCPASRRIEAFFTAKTSFPSFHDVGIA